jgi:hypothetical protein
MSPRQHGLIFSELAIGLIGVGLIATLIAGAVGAVRLRQRAESTSARLEEAQNLLARWRAGASVEAPGWTATLHEVGGATVLTLRGHGVQLSSRRPVVTR